MDFSPDKPGLLSLSLVTNPFPVTIGGFNNSFWFVWIERIMLSHDAHADEIVKTHGGSALIENEQQQEDADILFTITESMFAAIIVSAQSRIEFYYQRICNSIYVHINRTHALYAVNSKEKVQEQIKGKDLYKYIRRNSGVEIQNIKEFDVVDSIRVLSNIFKHNICNYMPKKTNIINPRIATAIGVAPNQKVIFSNLPIRDMFIRCGLYCAELKQQLMASFESDYA